MDCGAGATLSPMQTNGPGSSYEGVRPERVEELSLWM